MKRYLSIILGLLLSFSSVYPKVIIWDLGGVLLDTSHFAMGRSIGISHFLSYMLFDWKSPKIQPLLFEVLDLMPCPELPEPVYAFTHDGQRLPPIMCHWQAGDISGKQLIKKALDHIWDLRHAGFFVSYREMALVRKSIQKMFDAQSLAACTFPISSGIHLLEKCAQELLPDGSPKNTLIALSNWDRDSFAYVNEAYPELFRNFDHLFISGQTGMIKPRKATFEQVIQQCGLIPHECLVIDDQPQNLQAAKNLGFETFLLERGNYGALRKVLKDHKAIA